MPLFRSGKLTVTKAVVFNFFFPTTFRARAEAPTVSVHRAQANSQVPYPPPPHSQATSSIARAQVIRQMVNAIALPGFNDFFAN